MRNNVPFVLNLQFFSVSIILGTKPQNKSKSMMTNVVVCVAGNFCTNTSVSATTFYERFPPTYSHRSVVLRSMCHLLRTCAPRLHRQSCILDDTNTWHETCTLMLSRCTLPCAAVQEPGRWFLYGKIIFTLLFHFESWYI